MARLRSPSFDGLREKVVRNEAFESFFAVTGDLEEYVSALNPTQLKLAGLYEQADRVADARRLYRDVLAQRTDDASALAALARLASSDEERLRQLDASLDADPFSIDAIRDFQKVLSSREKSEIVPESGGGPGAQVRRALEQLQLGEARGARTTLQELAATYPDNDVVQLLLALTDIRLGDLDAAKVRAIRAPALSAQVGQWLSAAAVSAPGWLDRTSTAADASEGDLRSMISLLVDDRLTAAQRAALDRIVLSSMVALDAQPGPSLAGKTVVSTGHIGSVPIAFPRPTTLDAAGDGGIEEFTTAPFAGARRVAAPPFPTAFEVDGHFAYLVDPNDRTLLVIELASLAQASEQRIGRYPVDLAVVPGAVVAATGGLQLWNSMYWFSKHLLTSSSALAQGALLAVADPGQARVHLLACARKASDTARLRNGLGSALVFQRRALHVPTAVDRIAPAGTGWVAYDSARRVVYALVGTVVREVAADVGPHAFAAADGRVAVWNGSLSVITP